MGTVVAAALQEVRPKLAKRVNSTGKVELLNRDIGAAGGALARAADKVRFLALALLVLTVALVAGAIVVAPDRLRTVVQLGLGVAAGGVLLVVAYSVARSYAVGQVDGADNRAAAGAVFDAFLSDLRSLAWLMAGSGAVVAAAAASLIRPVDVNDPLRRLLKRLTAEPEAPVLRVARGTAIAGVGLLVIFDTDAVVSLVLTVAGTYLVYAGLTAVLRVIYRPPKREPEQMAPATGSRPPRWRRLAPAIVAMVLIVGASTIVLGSGVVTVAAPVGGPCNGHDQLCGRSLDQIALPATHNSMAVPLPGWFASEQDRPIPAQLTDGIRGLLLDTHYADRSPTASCAPTS